MPGLAVDIEPVIIIGVELTALTIHSSQIFCQRYIRRVFFVGRSVYRVCLTVVPTEKDNYTVCMVLYLENMNF